MRDADRDSMHDGKTYACQLQHFCRQVLENSRDIHRGFGADAHLILCVCLQEALYTTAGELLMVC